MSDEEIRDSSGAVDPKHRKEDIERKRAELEEDGRRSPDEPRPLVERSDGPPRPRARR